MENASGGRRGIAAAESDSGAGTTPQEPGNPASMIAGLERTAERQTAAIAEPKADLGEENAELAVPEAECRRVRGGRGENGIRRSGSGAKGGPNIREVSLKNLCST